MADLLLASPDRGPICDRLALGHRPDAAGVCGHPAHADLPERHPCSLVRLVTLVERLGRARDAA
ncbi:hypothetical protein [Pseudonocardia spirodelae]|uniref:Uncharacterized protein n=1 Tax=Pseudonocardia spirodelae TaxID=3133431 RepID=A0ABU8T2G7_9PSEU